MSTKNIEIIDIMKHKFDKETIHSGNLLSIHNSTKNENKRTHNLKCTLKYISIHLKLLSTVLNYNSNPPYTKGAS